MKKLFIILISLLVFYFFLKFLFNDNSKKITYKINDFEVLEEYQNNFYKIKILDYSFQVFKEFNKNQIVKDIKYLKEDNLFCFLPIFTNDKVYTDLICKIDNEYSSYNVLKGSNSKIDNFYLTINDYFNQTDSSFYTELNNTIYKDNILLNHYLNLTTYKGFVNLNPNTKKLTNIEIFENDVYDNYLSEFVDNYFVTVDYDEKYGYSKFIIYNTINLKRNEIILPINLEKNSYIQGIHENSLYIFDRDNKKQYALNPLKNTWLEVGNVEIGINVFKDEIVSAYECARNDCLFDFNLKENYSYKKVDDIYQIYYSYDNVKTHILNVQDISKLQTVDNVIYFVSDDSINYYSLENGIVKILTNNELNFNSKIKYKVFLKK